MTILLETPTDDSVEVSIGFLKECGAKLTDVSPKGINGKCNYNAFVCDQEISIPVGYINYGYVIKCMMVRCVFDDSFWVFFQQYSSVYGMFFMRQR